MAKLLHEIWVEDTSVGPIPSMVLQGPDGDTFRKGLAPGARLVLTFEAENNFEAMTAFYRYNGWGAYQLNLPDDQKPFPDSWRERQGILAPEPSQPETQETEPSSSREQPARYESPRSDLVAPAVGPDSGSLSAAALFDVIGSEPVSVHPVDRRYSKLVLDLKLADHGV